MRGSLPIAEDFTPIYERLGGVDVSVTEADALKETFWDLGEPARLREDIRFRMTPWGRWMRSDRWIANDRVLAWMAATGAYEVTVPEAFAAIPARLPLVFCSGDPRFNLRGRVISLTALGRKALPRPRVRDLSERGLEGRVESLRRRLQEAPIGRRTSTPEVDGDEELPGCALALDDDGLRIVIPPLGPDLVPNFVKRLRLMVSPTPLDFPLMRLRAGHEEAVPPMVEPYRWTGFMPDGQEVDDPDLLPILDRLATDGLAAGAVTAFRMAPDGRAWLGGRTVAPGGHYRIVFPPDVAVPEGITTTPAALWFDAWRVWELDLTLEADPHLAAILRALGLELGQLGIDLSWCGDPPSAWTSLGGQPAPVFDPRDRIAVRLGGGHEGAGALVALLVGVERTVRTSLDSSLPVLHCAELPVGPYVLEVVPRDVSVARARVWFEVREDAGGPPRAEVNVLWQDQVFAAAPDEDFRLLGDLSELVVTAPPCWSVVMRWQGLDQSRPVVGSVDRDGLLLGALSELGVGVSRDVRARLDVDFAELGRRQFEHMHLPREDEFLAILADLLPRAAHGLPRDVRALKQHWFEPLLRPVGFAVGEPDVDETSGAVCWRLSSMVESEGGLRPRATALLVYLPVGVEVAGTEARKIADRCASTVYRRVLVTDGLRWRRLVRRQVAGPAFDLAHAAQGGLALTVALEALASEIA